MADNNNPIKYSDLVSPDNSITDLIEQLEGLDKTYTNALKNIKAEAIQLAAILQKVSGVTENGRETTKKAANDADRLARAQKELAFAESDAAKKLAELNLAKNEANQINKLIVKLNQSAEGSYNKLSAQYSLNKIAINNMTQAERDEAEAKEGLITETREMYEEMKRLQKETGKNQLNVGNYTEASDAIIAYGDKLKKTLHLNNAFGDSLLAMGRGGEESKAVFTAMGNGAKALGKTLLGLLSNPVFLAIAGVAAAGAAFKWWYDYNAGLVEATKLTQDFTGKSGNDLKGYRNQVQAVADTFNVDFKETLIAANALAKQFGISADEALKLIQDGFVAGGNANGEFIDTLKEYPAYFKEAGISADQFVAIVAQTNKAGIFSDKGVDAIKEGNLRLREMTKATADALEGIGISSEQVQKDLQAGTKTTFQVMQEISQKLNEFPESSAKVGTAIADIFGGPGEDAGLQYLKTLKVIETNLETVKGEAGTLGQLQEEQLQSQLELENALSGLFDLTGGNFESLTTKAKTFVNGGIVAIIKGVISVINFFRELYNDSVAIRAVWNGITAAFKINIDFIGNLFNYLIDLIQATARALKGAFTLDLSEIKAGVYDFANALPNLIKAQMKDTADNFREGLEDMNKKLKPITIPVNVGTPKMTGNAPKQTGGITDQAVVKNAEEVAKEVKNVKQKENEDLLKLEQERQLKEFELQKKAIELRLAAVKEGSEQERKLRLQLLEVERKEELYKNKQNPAGQRLDETDINAKFSKKSAGINDEYLKLQLAAFDQEQKLAQSEFDLLRNSEERKTRFRLKAEKERLQKILEINKQSSQKMTDVEVQTVENTIKKIDQEIEESKGKERSNDIYGLFGLNLDDDQKEAISTSVSFAVEALNNFMAAKVAAADKAVENADREVDSAQRVLDAELEARANGYANNVAMAQKELDLAKKNQAKAIKDQQKAQKQQAAIQSIQQIGNMVTATSLIWAQLGFPAAIPAIAIMWASFAASKIKAAQLAKKSSGGDDKEEKYGDGTVELLQGGSHQSGHDIDLGRKPDGTKRRAEGGEFFAVINKRNSARYRKVIPDVINSLNDGTFAQKYMTAYNGADGLTINVSEQRPDLRGLSDDVRAIRRQNQRKVHVTGDGKTIIEYKNLTRKIN